MRSWLRLVFLLALVIATIFIIRRRQDPPYQHNSGSVFGTVYNISYQWDDDLQPDIKAELERVDRSLSTFNDKSIISRVNRNEAVELDEYFTAVVSLALAVSDDTDGAFDITVAPLVNAWGFGFDSQEEARTDTTRAARLDSLRAIVGYDKITLVTDGSERPRLTKSDPRVMLDCSAIAKGFGCDCVARLLRSRGIDNFMIEIGGEVVTAGVNAQGNDWRIGVARPVDDSTGATNGVQTVINVSGRALATSGNYRNFYYDKDSVKYAHTIDPRTGHPVQHSLLSATVIADDCATADAYATAFMVMGLDKAQALLARRPELRAYLIYAADDGSYAVWSTVDDLISP